MLPLILCIVVTVLDQGTKWFVREHIAYGELIEVIPGFMNLTHLTNTGAAWGMFSSQNLSLTVLSVVMLALMVIFRRSFLSDTLWHRIALGLLCGGIIGNLVDRIKLRGVTDFLDFYAGGWHWPSFNVADSAICVGVSIYIVTTLLESRREATPGEADEPSA
jgi:signal peptidase II